MDEAMWIGALLFIVPCILMLGIYVCFRFLIPWLFGGVDEVVFNLPTIYYFFGTFGGIALLGFVVAISDELGSAEIGAWIGYTVGAVLSMFAVGRVIKLLENLNTAVIQLIDLEISKLKLPVEETPVPQIPYKPPAKRK